MWVCTRVLFILCFHGLAGTWLMEGSQWICGMKSAGKHASGWSWPCGCLRLYLISLRCFSPTTKLPFIGHLIHGTVELQTARCTWDATLCFLVMTIPHLPLGSAWWRNFSGVTQKVRRPGFITQSGDSHRQLLNATFEWPLYVRHDARHQG